MPEVINPAAETSAETVDSPEKFKTRGREVIENYTLEQLEAYLKEQEAEIARLEQENESLETQEFALETSVNYSDIDRTRERTKKNPGAKKFFTMKTALVMAAVVATLALFGGVAIDSPNEINSPTYNIAASSDENVGESIAKLKTYRGRYASEDGTTYNPEKSSKLSFGEALRTGVSEEEMKKDFGDGMVQTGPLAATYYYMQEKTTNPNFGVDGAKFNNTNALIEAMNEDGDLHQKVYDYVMSIINKDKMYEDTVTGPFHNFFMNSEFETGDIDTSNVEVVGCTTYEHETKVYKMEDSWTDEDGTIHADIFTFKASCGGQPLDEYDFTTTSRQLPGDPENSTPPTTPPTITPTAPPTTPPGTQPPREWGKSGDPRGGDLVGVSEQVNPQSEVTRVESEEVNRGNQGYKNDNQAAPGASSESNGINESGFSGSEVKAEGASTDSGSRLSGGENQSSGINGNNSQNSNNEGRVVDNSGNSAQSIAQASGGENNNGATPGGNNYSDAGEVAAVENGDF